MLLHAVRPRWLQCALHHTEGTADVWPKKFESSDKRHQKNLLTHEMNVYLLGSSLPYLEEVQLSSHEGEWHLAGESPSSLYQPCEQQYSWEAIKPQYECK